MSELKVDYGGPVKSDNCSFIVYKIYDPTRNRKFPAKEEIDRIADEVLLCRKHVPQKISYVDGHMIISFRSGVFKSKKDRRARKKFFAKVINIAEKM